MYYTLFTKEKNSSSIGYINEISIDRYHSKSLELSSLDITCFNYVPIGRCTTFVQPYQNNFKTY